MNNSVGKREGVLEKIKYPYEYFIFFNKDFHDTTQKFNKLNSNFIKIFWL